MKGWIRFTIEGDKSVYFHVSDILNWRDNYVRYKEGNEGPMGLMVKQNAKEIADLMRDAMKESWKK